MTTAPEALPAAALAEAPAALAVLDAGGGVVWSSRAFDALLGSPDAWGDAVQAGLGRLVAGADAAKVVRPGHAVERLDLRAHALDGGGAAVVAAVAADPLGARVAAAEAALHALARPRPDLLALLEAAAVHVGQALAAGVAVALVGGADDYVRCAVWPPDAAPGLVTAAVPPGDGSGRARDVSAPPVLAALGAAHALAVPVGGDLPALVVVGRGRPWRPDERAAADRLGVLVATLWGWAEAEDRFERTVADLDDALFTVAHDADGRRRYAFVSPQAEALTGLDPDAVLAGDADWSALVVDGDRAAFAAHDARLRAGRPSTVDVRLVVGGDVAWVRERATPGLDAAGNVATGGLLADVTAQHEAEAQLRRARRAAERAAHTRMAFLRTMSHELRTPLGVIRGFADLLADEVADLAAPPEVAEFADAIQTAAGRALRLVSDLLDLSRLETKALDLRRMPVALGPLLAAVAGRHRPALDGRGVALHVEPTDAAALADPARVEQVVEQLLANAAKFTERGAVAVRVRAEGGAVRVEVADTGVGVAADALDDVFEPFVQGDARVNRRFEGTGLGLAVARRLADQMGGGLTATSVEGEGSTFTLTLPRDEG
ncbi:PAS domain-containing sensor histidine kinase [Rubrivirga sp. S365]|uniref:sensor histidine kinase n=1 Tax=Rubrivirga sp. S365 TaxID=3076080 RepID=UPI0028C72347|nr:PAS domain-containing sensor histidine kinase [Rubrivirga sp. S365]MDT7857592.1 PAS domain-containing sensor histidine kinase [Rubrivirga sp. S365]